jgi:hypothetical protein
MSTFFKLMIVLVLAVAGWQHYTKQPGRTATGDAQAEAGAEASRSRGFVPLPAFAGSSGRAVVIFAPENCPEDAGRRADALADSLGRSGVPVSRMSHVSFTMTDADPSTVQRVNAVMTGTIPIVVVRGRGKANPSLDEVLAEYSAAR